MQDRHLRLERTRRPTGTSLPESPKTWRRADAKSAIAAARRRPARTSHSPTGTLRCVQTLVRCTGHISPSAGRPDWPLCPSLPRSWRVRRLQLTRQRDAQLRRPHPGVTACSVILRRTSGRATTFTLAASLQSARGKTSRTLRASTATRSATPQFSRDITALCAGESAMGLSESLTADSRPQAAVVLHQRCARGRSCAPGRACHSR